MLRNILVKKLLGNDLVGGWQLFICFSYCVMLQSHKHPYVSAD